MTKIANIVYKKVLNMNRRQEVILTVLMILLGTFLFLLYSPVHPLVEGCTGTDSSVFKTVALMMEKGYMPYRDSFDHKGPLLFILNFVGNKISYYVGVWFIEYLFLAIAFYAIYMIARLFCNIWQSMAIFFIAMILMCGYFEEGNLTEEYAMMFIAVSLYIFIDYFENEKITYLRVFICGTTFAGTLMLRPNMIAVWLVMCLAVLIKLIAEKNYKKLLIFIGWFVLGMTLIIIPILIWLYCNGALQSCWNDYIIFNQQYTSTAGGRATLIAKCKSFINFACTPIYLIALFLQLYTWINKKGIFNIAYLLLMIVTPVLICISGQSYGHYGMILVPVVVYPMAKAFQEFNSLSCNAHIKSLLCVICFAVFVGVGFSAYGSLGYHILKNCMNKINGENISTSVEEICDTLDEYGIGEDEPISVYGNWNIIYVLSKRPHATRYSYQFPIGQVMPSIMDEYMSQLKEERPEAIVVAPEKYDDNISKFLDENSYKLVWIDTESISGEDSAKDTSGCAQLYILR